MNYKCWLGKPGFFKEEVSQLIDLLNKEIIPGRSTIMLSPNAEPGFDWICDELHNNTSLAHPGSISLRTSGTTGVPKLLWKTASQVLESKKGRGSSSDKWLLTYNPARWAGLSVVFHTIKTNAQLVLPDSLSPTDLLDKIPFATHVSLTPSLFRKLMVVDSGQLRSANIQQVTFGGEYATQKILDDARALWPQANVTHIYATTELGDICACSDGLEGLPTNKIRANFSLLDTGELVLEESPTGDIWKLEQNRLYFVGRMTETINVGGAKVTETTVENATLKILGIDDCKAYAVENALLGQVVGLDYVGNIEPIQVKKELLKVLPKYAVPVKINKVDTIPLTAAGKKARR